MRTDTIGANAGAIWRLLSGQGGLGLSALKRLARLDDRELYLALGWLAREDKIAVTQTGRQTVVSLKPDDG